MSDIVDRLIIEPLSYELVKDAKAEIIRLRNQLDAARTGKALLALEAERALCDQLAEALRYTHPVGGVYDKGGNCLSCAALAAHAAARKEGT